MTAHVYNSGWKTLEDLYVNISGSWRRIEQGWVHNSGSWREFYAYDTVGPGAVVNASAIWNNVGVLKNNVSWVSPSDSDFDHTKLYVNRSGSPTGPWTYIGQFSSGPTTVSTHADSTLSLSPYTAHHPNNYSCPTHYYRFITYDTRGNQGSTTIVGSTGQNSSVVRGIMSSPYYVYPSTSRTWRGGAWATGATVDDGTGPDRVMQGYTPSSGENLGFWFYENRRSGLFPITSDIYIYRTSGIGFSSAQIPKMYSSTTGSGHIGTNTDPTGLTHTGPANANALAHNQGAWNPISILWAIDLMEGNRNSIMTRSGETTTAGGYNFSNAYSRYQSFREGGITKGGSLRIYHEG